jgi:hypothetical protein
MAVEATIWLVLVVAGFALLRALDYVHHEWLAAAMLRLAAVSFVGAGVIGARGWVGGFLAGAVHFVNATAARFGVAALGTGAVWVVWMVLTVAWVLTLLPDRWFDAVIPDWLSISGIVLPGLAASIPGHAGDLLRQLIHTLGGSMVTFVRQALGL